MRAEVRRDAGAPPVCAEGRAQAERASAEGAPRVRGDEEAGWKRDLINRVEHVEHVEGKMR